MLSSRKHINSKTSWPIVSPHHADWFVLAKNEEEREAPTSQAGCKWGNWAIQGSESPHVSILPSAPSPLGTGQWEANSSAGTKCKGPIRMPPTSRCGLSNAVILWNSPFSNWRSPGKPLINQSHQATLPETPLSTHHLADGQHSGVLIYQSWTEFSPGLVIPGIMPRGKKEKRQKKEKETNIRWFFAIGLTFPYTTSHLNLQPLWEHHI